MRWWQSAAKEGAQLRGSLPCLAAEGEAEPPLQLVDPRVAEGRRAEDDGGPGVPVDGEERNGLGRVGREKGGGNVRGVGDANRH